MMSNLIVLVGFAALASSAPFAKRDSVYGFDISHYQYVYSYIGRALHSESSTKLLIVIRLSVNFDAAYNDGGMRFVRAPTDESKL